MGLPPSTRMHRPREVRLTQRVRQTPGVSVRMLQDWEQGRREPGAHRPDHGEKHPKVLRAVAEQSAYEPAIRPAAAFAPRPKVPVFRLCRYACAISSDCAARAQRSAQHLDRVYLRMSISGYRSRVGSSSAVRGQTADPRARGQPSRYQLP